MTPEQDYHNTRQGAAQTAQDIEDYWRARGHPQVRAWIVHTPDPDQKQCGVWGVRTNLNPGSLCPRTDGGADVSETEAFYEQHCAVPGGVVVVTLYGDDGSSVTGIFSTLAKAMAWADSVRSEDDDRAAVYAPYVIDAPDYGNVPAKEMQ